MRARSAKRGPALRSLRKVAGGGVHRTIAAARTWQRLAAPLERCGVTRVADITGLDHLGIPVFSCVRPSAVRASVSVTCGKGMSRAQARVGAAMEAIEYHCAERAAAGVRRASFDEIARRERALDPRDLVLPEWSPYRPDRTIEWMPGWCLRSGDPCWIPANVVLHPYDPRGAGLMILRGSTNGLASGNEIEEAICHGLAEAIERDAWSLCWARVRFGAGAAVPGVNLESVDGECAELLAHFRRRQIDVFVRVLTSDVAVPAFYAATLERTTHGLLTHEGIGAHPDPAVALSRALTEAAQSRAADIQGSREDLDYWRRRAGAWDGSAAVWGLTAPAIVKPFSECGGALHADIRDDIHWMLARLDQAALTRAYAVDLTDPTIGVPVVRVVVPGLEFTAIDEYRAGPRVRRVAAATTECA